ncbi:MAG: hypothetical protein R3C58_04965 [Parvularculaceae bacterium]
MWLLAVFSKSPQILAAARIIFAYWVVSLQVYLIFGWHVSAACYAFIEFAAAAAFFHMARGRAFPLPLFVIHALLVVWHVASLSFDESRFGYLQAALNRVFEVELIYIGGCAAYRIAMLRRSAHARGARL